MGIWDSLKKSVNAFTTPDDSPSTSPFEQGIYSSPIGTFGQSYGARPDRLRTRASNDKSIVTSIYTRIAIDGASVQIKHTRHDDQDRYLETINSGLNNCLTLEANIDQAARAFRQDAFMTLCDKGYLALVPVDTDTDPTLTNTYDILTMRVGEIVDWYPRHVKVSVYNDNNGKREDLILSKARVAIVENPLYAVMNEPNSTLQRLIHKLSLLDSVDEASASGKLDLIIQLPYVIKSEARKQQAEQRRSDIEYQLREGKYGIAYTDGTEKITQLNRPVENNLLGQIEFLAKKLYGELGITEEVMNGTANETTMLNYWNRTIEPLVNAVVEGCRRTFLTKTARSQKQSVDYFRDPFALVPVGAIADIAQVMTANEIMTSNEMRQVIGMKPSTDPKADQLVNSNINPNVPGGTAPAVDPAAPVDPNAATAPDDAEAPPADVASHADVFDAVNGQLDDLFKQLGVDEGADDES
jgi:hypothetical protein